MLEAIKKEINVTALSRAPRRGKFIPSSDFL
jgi:hypothetical protein